MTTRPGSCSATQWRPICCVRKNVPVTLVSDTVFEIVTRSLDRFTAQIDAGIIDQDVDLAECLDGVGRRLLDARLRAQIEFKADRLLPGFADSCQSRGKIALARRRHHEIKAVARQRYRSRSTHAIGSACNQRGFLGFAQVIKPL